MAAQGHIIRWTAVATLCALAGCADATVTGKCGTGPACTGGLRCVDGNCICTSNSDCPSGQECNSSGFCQTTLGCQTSLDCPNETFCDTTTGTCIANTLCTEDIQCPLDQVCDTASFHCVPGCREVGDCDLGDVCQCSNGTDATSTASCPSGELGTCLTGPCGDNSYCPYGDICVADVDGGPKSCQVDTSGPFCQPCTFVAGQVDPCAGSTPNFCLVDTTKTFAADFCGVDCSQGEECPNGFTCSDVLILTDQTCGSSGFQCPDRPAPMCQTDADCQNQRGGVCNPSTHLCVCQNDADCPGGECDPVTGECRSTCIIGDGQEQGFCTCLEDSDCPTDSCNSQDQRCAIQQTDCDPSAAAGTAGSCPQIFCKKVADPLSGVITGYCYIGQNCAPEDGISCDQVLMNQ